MSLNLGFRPRTASQVRSPGTTRRELRWVILISVPVVLLAGLLFAMQEPPIADAASPSTYVDCTGGGQTPNFPTIQEAVSNTAPSGVVHICTGTYSESVNLALMNGGGGIGNEGNLAVIAEDGPGTVKIAPLAGPALYISITPFSGDIVLEGLDVTSGDSAAINFANLDKYVSGTLTISGVVAHDAAQQGIVAQASQDILIVNSQAISNGNVGFFLAALGNVTIDNSSALFNGTAGIGFSGGGYQVTDYSYQPPPISCPSPIPTITFINSIANDNGGFGINAYSQWHHLRIDTTNAHRNAYDGILAYVSTHMSCKTDLTVVDSTANNNGFAGSNSVLYGGFNLNSPELLEVARSRAEGNNGFGFCMDAYLGGPLMMEDSTAQDNGTVGFGVPRSACGPYLLGTPQPPAPAQPTFGPTVVMITNTSAISNGTNGFAFSLGDLITLTNISALRNVSEGVEFLFGTPFERPPFDVSMSWLKDSLIVDNQGYGVEYELQSTQVQDLTQPLAPAGILSATQFANNSIICDNLKGGLAISDVAITLPPPAAPAAPELFTPGPLEVNATANWWGDNSGPAHPSNPGAGDAIFDTSNGFTGTVYVNPFIDQITGTAAANPTLPGLPVNVNFQFSGAASTVFLGQGVGNLNDPPPFTVSTDNGGVEGNHPAAVGPSIAQFIGPSNGLLSVMLTPSSAGVANVSLQGPCNLTVTTPVLVAAPSISLVKTVGVLGASPSCPGSGTVSIEQGEVVEYCYTVTNTGEFTLSTHSLVDDKLGVLLTDVPFELGPGASVSTFELGEVITTALNITTTNIATWTAAVDPVVNVNSASVTASNVATVNVEGTPTAIDPDDQPVLPRRIFVPNLNR